jgi:hypothetical protein
LGFASGTHASGVTNDKLVENLIASMTSSETQLLHIWRDVERSESKP